MKDILTIIGPVTRPAGSSPVSKSDLAALGLAQRAAGTTGGAHDVLLLGPESVAGAEELKKFGARTVYVVSHEDLTEYTAEGYAAAVDAFVKKRETGDQGYRLVVAATSSQTREFFPRLAARLDLPMASDVVAIENLDETNVSFTRAVFVGNLLASVSLSGPCALVTCRASEFAPATAGGEESAVESVVLGTACGHSGKRFVKLEQAVSDRPDLKDAEIIVSVGRGTRGPDEGIPLAEALADALGAAVGATRAVVDAGWMPNEFQVGQTGKIVAPNLYLAIGLSGAIQHLAGMRNSKTIVAINKDPEAPIFEVADVGLVADLFEAVPELTQQLQAAKQS